MANKTLADMAIYAITKADWAPLEPTWCQRTFRLEVQHCCGSKYDRYMKESARLTGLAFKDSPFALPPTTPLEDGDIVFKVPTEGYGHVGVNTVARGIAENSSTSIGRVRGALGFRSVSEFGAFQLIVRLPDPNAVADGYKLIASDKHEMATLKIIDGHNYVKARNYADWYKLPIAWQAPKVLLNNIEISDVKLIKEDGTNWAYVPFVDAAQVNGIVYVTDVPNREIRLQPVK